jgi:hypothetical protein
LYITCVKSAPISNSRQSDRNDSIIYPQDNNNNLPIQNNAKNSGSTSTLRTSNNGVSQITTPTTLRSNLRTTLVPRINNGGFNTVSTTQKISTTSSIQQQHTVPNRLITTVKTTTNIQATPTTVTTNKNVRNNITISSSPKLTTMLQNRGQVDGSDSIVFRGDESATTEMIPLATRRMFSAPDMRDCPEGQMRTRKNSACRDSIGK